MLPVLSASTLLMLCCLSFHFYQHFQCRAKNILRCKWFVAKDDGKFNFVPLAFCVYLLCLILISSTIALKYVHNCNALHPDVQHLIYPQLPPFSYLTDQTGFARFTSLSLNSPSDWIVYVAVCLTMLFDPLFAFYRYFGTIRSVQDLRAPSFDAVLKRFSVYAFFIVCLFVFQTQFYYWSFPLVLLCYAVPSMYWNNYVAYMLLLAYERLSVDDAELALDRNQEENEAFLHSIRLIRNLAVVSCLCSSVSLAVFMIIYDIEAAYYLPSIWAVSTIFSACNFLRNRNKCGGCTFQHCPCKMGAMPCDLRRRFPPLATNSTQSTLASISVERRPKFVDVPQQQGVELAVASPVEPVQVNDIKCNDESVIVDDCYDEEPGTTDAMQTTYILPKSALPSLNETVAAAPAAILIPTAINRRTIRSASETDVAQSNKAKSNRNKKNTPLSMGAHAIAMNNNPRLNMYDITNETDIIDEETEQDMHVTLRAQMYHPTAPTPQTSTVVETPNMQGLRERNTAGDAQSDHYFGTIGVAGRHKEEASVDMSVISVTEMEDSDRDPSVSVAPRRNELNDSLNVPSPQLFHKASSLPTVVTAPSGGNRALPKARSRNDIHSVTTNATSPSNILDALQKAEKQSKLNRFPKTFLLSRKPRISVSSAQESISVINLFVSQGFGSKLNVNSIAPSTAT